MNKNKTKKVTLGVIKLVSFLLLLLVCLNVIINITKRKEYYNKYIDFHSQKADFDVLFFGTSHVVNGINPMELYNNYGIISYNMANHSEEMYITYYNMLLALQETHPKLIVLDAFGIVDSTSVKKSMMHRAFDSYPITLQKIKAIRELSTKDDLLDNMFEYLFNFSLYHSRWKDIEKEDFQVNKNRLKGAEFLKQINTRVNTNNYESAPIIREDIDNIKAFRKIIKYCKQNDIQVLVTFDPCTPGEKVIGRSKYIEEICNENEVNYINFLQDRELINYTSDFADQWSHLNPAGAKKLTNYIGKYIIENYNITDQRKNSEYDSWKEDYDKYIDYKIKQMESQEKNLGCYLMLLYGENDIGYKIEISSNVKITNESLLGNLLENLNNSYEINDMAFTKQKDKNIKVTTYDKRNEKVIKEIYFKN